MAEGLSPSKELLHGYRSGEKTWASFGRGFRKEMKSSPSAQKAIAGLRAEASEKTLTLLCYEKEDEHCHRHIVAEMLG